MTQRTRLPKTVDSEDSSSKAAEHQEIEAAEHQEQVQRNFRALARAGLQRLCLALKKAPVTGFCGFLDVFGGVT